MNDLGWSVTWIWVCGWALPALCSCKYVGIKTKAPISGFEAMREAASPLGMYPGCSGTVLTNGPCLLESGLNVLDILTVPVHIRREQSVLPRQLPAQIIAQKQVTWKRKMWRGSSASNICCYSWSDIKENSNTKTEPLVHQNSDGLKNFSFTIFSS